jgi:hypothetical protein
MPARKATTPAAIFRHYFTIAQVADALSVSSRSVRRWSSHAIFRSTGSAAPSCYNDQGPTRRAGAYPFRREADVFHRRRHRSFRPESVDDLQQDEKWRDRVDKNRRAKIDQSAVAAPASGGVVTMPASPRFFTISDIADCLDVSSRTVRRWI